MASFLKWASDVLDKVDSSASETINALRDDEGRAPIRQDHQSDDVSSKMHVLPVHSVSTAVPVRLAPSLTKPRAPASPQPALSTDDLMDMLNTPPPAARVGPHSGGLSSSPPPPTFSSAAVFRPIAPLPAPSDPNSPNSPALTTPLLLPQPPIADHLSASNPASLANEAAPPAQTPVHALSPALTENAPVPLGPTPTLAPSPIPAPSPVLLSPLALVQASALTPVAVTKPAQPDISHPPEPRLNKSEPLADSMEVGSEVASLRKVWHETRASLAKAKELLITKEEQYRRSLREHDAQTQQLLQEQKDAADAEIASIKRTLAQNHLDFEEALQAKAAHRLSQERALDEARSDASILREELAEAGKRALLLEQERDELIRLQAEQLEAHSRILKQLKEDQTNRDLTLEQEHKLHHSTLHHFQSRETSLEADNIEYVHALAAAQRSLEEKSAQLQRVLAEKRWVEADQQALQDQLTAAKARLDVEQKQAASLQASLRAQLSGLQQRTEDLQNQLSESRTKATEEHRRLTDLQHQIAAEEASPLHARVAELEKRLRTMADHLLAKNAEMDLAAAERAALRLQLENETARVQQSERQLRELRELQAAEGFSTTDLEAGGLKLRGRGSANPMALSGLGLGGGLDSSSGDIKMRTVARAVGFLDQIGVSVGLLLRRYPAVRVGFALYVLLLHLWIVFVLAHFMGHEVPSTPTRGLIGPGPGGVI